MIWQHNRERGRGRIHLVTSDGRLFCTNRQIAQPLLWSKIDHVNSIFFRNWACRKCLSKYLIGPQGPKEQNEHRTL